MSAFNRPQFRNDDGEQKIKRYVHSPLTVEHNGIQCTITKNGKVQLSKPVLVKEGDEEITEFEEIEVSASLIFKMANLLKATRQVKYVTLQELKSDPNATAEIERE